MRTSARNWAYVAAVVLLASAVCASAMSIEAEPVKVTHRNSGPRYDIDVERTRLTGADQEQAVPQPQPPQQAADARPATSESSPDGGPAAGDEPNPIGHVAIRRIFLFPIRPYSDWSESESGPRDMQAQPASTSSQREQENERESVPSMFAKPFWPFMTPARPMSPGHPSEQERPHRPHLFGADEASRSPSDRDQDKLASGPERDQTPVTGSQQQPLFDPIQMMMDLMHQAISSQLAPNFTPDLNNNSSKEPSSSNDNAPAESSDERPQMPGSELATRLPAGLSPKNETREDIVEIEGKKYLRKTVTSRHVGENIIFMTRRLIFVPLNETDSATPDTIAITTTDLPATTAPVAGEPEAGPVAVDRVGANKPAPTSEAPPAEQATATSATASTSQSSTSVPSSSASPTEAPSTAQPATTSGEPSAAEFTTPKSSTWPDRVSEAAGRAADRLVEEATSKQTPAPAGNETPKPVEPSAQA